MSPFPERNTTERQEENFTLFLVTMYIAHDRGHMPNVPSNLPAKRDESFPSGVGHRALHLLHVAVACGHRCTPTCAGSWFPPSSCGFLARFKFNVYGRCHSQILFLLGLFHMHTLEGTGTSLRAPYCSRPFSFPQDPREVGNITITILHLREPRDTAGLVACPWGPGRWQKWVHEDT